MSIRWRRLIYGALVVILLLHVGGGWYFSDQLRADVLVPENSGPAYDIAVTEIGDGAVTLRPVEDEDPDLIAPGIIGLDWESGYGQLGEIVDEASDGSVTRRMNRIEGEAPEVGMLADLDGNAFPADPQRSFGIDFSEIQYQSPLGSMTAWRILAPNDLWVIYVHGLGASRAEALRMIQMVTDAGYPQIAISYRNDPGQPADPSGYYQYGQTEWEDVKAAVDQATSAGARQILLVGYSTGASHILSYLFRTPDSPVVAAILDSPNIDLEETVNLGASQRSLPIIPIKVPPSIVWVAKRMSSFRYGLSWNSIDYVAQADKLHIPVLVFHGAVDETVPLRTSQDFHAARPDLIRLVIVPGAGHVRSWNVGPESYERRVVDFLNEVAG